MACTRSGRPVSLTPRGGVRAPEVCATSGAAHLNGHVGAQLYAVCLNEHEFDEHEFWRLYALADADGCSYVSEFGKRPVHAMVIRRDRPDLMTALLKKGKPHQIDALMLCAAQHNRIESARALLKAGADRDVSIQDMARSAATIARAKGHPEILQMLRGQLDAARTRRDEKPDHVLIDPLPAD